MVTYHTVNLPTKIFKRFRKLKHKRQSDAGFLDELMDKHEGKVK